jgi:hypothetical protein
MQLAPTDADVLGAPSSTLGTRRFVSADSPAAVIAIRVHRRHHGHRYARCHTCGSSPLAKRDSFRPPTKAVRHRAASQAQSARRPRGRGVVPARRP